MVHDHPFLDRQSIRSLPPNEAVSIFDASLNGHRVTMAATGYFHDGKPLLYDRGTESLWVEERQTSLTGGRRQTSRN